MVEEAVVVPVLLVLMELVLALVPEEMAVLEYNCRIGPAIVLGDPAPGAPTPGGYWFAGGGGGASYNPAPTPDRIGEGGAGGGGGGAPTYTSPSSR